MIRKFRLSLLMSVLTLCLSSVSVVNMQVESDLYTSKVSEISEVQYAMGGLPSIYDVGLQNEYSSDLISMNFYVSSEYDFDNIYYTVSSVDVLDSLFDSNNSIATYDIKLLAEESSFTVLADDENYSSVYFAKSSDNLFFASPSSLDDATSKMITYEYESEIISYDEYVERTRQLYSSCVIEPNYTPPTTFASTSSDKIRVWGTYRWIDDKNDSHLLSYTKVVVSRTYYLKRIFFPSIIPIPVTIDNTFYTNKNGYFDFEFKDVPTLEDTDLSQYTSLALTEF